MAVQHKPSHTGSNCLNTHFTHSSKSLIKAFNNNILHFQGNSRCAVAVVRISGSNSKDVCHKIAGMSEPKPRVATLRKLRDPVTNELLDNGIVIWFPGK